MSVIFFSSERWIVVTVSDTGEMYCLSLRSGEYCLVWSVQSRDRARKPEVQSTELCISSSVW